MPTMGLLGGANFDYDQALKMLEDSAKSETERNITNQQISAQNRAAKGKLATTVASPFVNLGAREALSKGKDAIKGLTAPSTMPAASSTTVTPLGSGMGGSAVAGAQTAETAAPGLAAPTAADVGGTVGQLGSSVAPSATDAAPLATDAAANAGDFSAGPYALIPAGIDLAAHAAGLKGPAAKAVDVGAGAASGALAGATVGSAFPVVGTAIGGAAGGVLGAVASYFG